MARRRRRAWTEGDKKRLLARQRREARKRPARTSAAEATASAPTPTDKREQDRILASGRDCLRRIKNDQTYEDWRGIGAALMVITQQTLDELEEDEWDGGDKNMVHVFNRKWSLYESDVGSNHKPLSKQERWALRLLMTNPEIHAWRASLDSELQRQMIHPNTVVTKWKREAKTPDFAAAFEPVVMFMQARHRGHDLDRFVEPAYDLWVGGLRLTKWLRELAQFITEFDNACQAKLNDPEEGAALKERVRLKDRVRLRSEFDESRGGRAKELNPSIFAGVQFGEEDENEEDDDEE